MTHLELIRNLHGMNLTYLVARNFLSLEPFRFRARYSIVYRLNYDRSVEFLYRLSVEAAADLGTTVFYLRNFVAKAFLLGKVRFATRLCRSAAW
jgi:hypothetical protein